MLTHKILDDGYSVVFLIDKPIGFYKFIDGEFRAFKRIESVLTFRILPTLEELEQWLMPVVVSNPL